MICYLKYRVQVANFEFKDKLINKGEFIFITEVS
jgi:hypothetical protein